MVKHSDIEAAVRDWLEQIVVGMNVCPFASPVMRAGGLDLRMSPAHDLEGAYQDALRASVDLLAMDEDKPATTLVAFPDAGMSFADFLDVVAALRGTLSESGADGILQVATFHPDYVFDGEPEGDPSHWTNRAPCALVHLLRESDVLLAVESHPNVEAIPARNIEHFRALGTERLANLWANFGRRESE